ncbi:MAG: TonB family protein [Bacteroidales bacterium]|nr:TonB family protein [Bacteroidales bacterium]
MESSSILIYLLKSTVAFTALYGLFLLLFRKNQHFAISRFYLLFTIVFASLFPLIKFISYKTVEIPAFETAIPEITDFGQEIVSVEPDISFWESDSIVGVMLYLHLMVSSLILLRLLYMLIRFGVNLLRYSRVERLYGKRVIVSDYWNQTFSFFGIIVLPQKDFQLKENQLLIQHELVHVRQYHTLDLLLAELFQVLHWFNPLAYLIKKDMREVHEFLADYSVVKGGASKYAYQQLLLNYLASSVTPRVANSFSAKLLKKRFAMMTTNKTPKSVLIKYTLAIPVIAVLIGLMSFQTKVRYIKNDNALMPEKRNEIAVKQYVANDKQPPVFLQENEPGIQKNIESVAEMLTRMKRNLDPKSELKIIEVGKDEFNEIIVLKSGVVYNVYVVGEAKDKIIKTHPLLMKVNNDERAEIIPSRIDMALGQNCIEYQCKETGTYNLSLFNREPGKKYVIGIYFKEMFEIPTNEGNVEIIEVKSNKECQKIDTLKYEPFVVVEQMPMFDNRDVAAAREYIVKNVKYPEIAAKNGIQGKVYVSFVVEENGVVSTVKIEHGVDPILDKEAIRVVESMPKWTPGYQRGQAVRVKIILPVVFKLDDKK